MREEGLMELTTSLFLQLILQGLIMGVIYATIALGLTMVYGLLRILHIAHASVYTWGAYVALTVYLATHNILLAILACSAVCAILGILIERGLYLPMLDKPAYVPLIMSVATYLLMCELCANIWGHYPLGFHVAELPRESFNVGGVVIGTHQLVLLAIISGLIVVLWFIINRTKVGLASRAVAQDQDVAKVMGINVRKIVDFNFIVSSILAGIGGTLVGMYYAELKPYMGDVVAYKALVVIVLGGLGSVPGAIVGSLILGIAETFLIAFFGHLLPREAFAFIIMIILLLFRPQGLFGRAE